MAVNATSADVLESLGVRDALRAVPYASAVLLNTIDLAAILLAFRAIGVLMVHFRWSFWIAAFVPSLFFGAFHVYQGEGLVESLSIAALTAIGSFWFGWIYWKWDFNLWPAIWLHVGLNSAWTLFALGENALGGQLGNIIRVGVIAGSIALTVWGQRRLRRAVGETRAA